MAKKYQIGDCTLYQGNCLDVLPTLEDFVDAVVTDPPYALTGSGSRKGSPRINNPETPFGRHALQSKGFMGLHWDGQLPTSDHWQATLRVLKPGGYMLCFGGTRTYHRLTCAVEDAGFEIRDCLMWLHGQGFPKGKGCLKPAWEPILLCRKPGPKVLPLGIDECRITGTCRKPGNTKPTRASGSNGIYGRDERLTRQVEWEPSAHGRWPANLILSHHPACNGQCDPDCPIQRLDAQAGPQKSGGTPPRRFADKTKNAYGRFEGQENPNGIGRSAGNVSRFFLNCHPECPIRLLDAQSGITTSGAMKREVEAYQGDSNTGFLRGRSGPSNQHGDRGGASRFFYCPKASRRDRGEGNTHPTVKPLKLMEWLVKLVCPAGGTVLDQFLGSGSTGVACQRTGRRFIGIEQNSEYMKIARTRLKRKEPTHV